MLSVVELFFALKQKIYINENNIDSDNDVICTQSIKKNYCLVSAFDCHCFDALTFHRTILINIHG